MRHLPQKTAVAMAIPVGRSTKLPRARNVKTMVPRANPTAYVEPRRLRRSRRPALQGQIHQNDRGQQAAGIEDELGLSARQIWPDDLPKPMGDNGGVHRQERARESLHGSAHRILALYFRNCSPMKLSTKAKKLSPRPSVRLKRTVFRRVLPIPCLDLG